METYQQLKKIFERILSIQITDSNIDEDYFSISAISSLEFISLIVEIESVFEVNFDDEFLNMEKINTFTKLYNVIKGMINDEKNTGTDSKIQFWKCSLLFKTQNL